MAFLIPARGPDALRTIEIKNLSQQGNENPKNLRIRILGVFYGERCVLTPKQLHDQAQKTGRWKVRNNALFGKSGASLFWKGRLPYSLEHCLALRLGYGPNAGKSLIVLDGDSQIEYLHFFRGGSNLNILFSKTKHSLHMIFDCMQRIIFSVSIVQIMIFLIALAGCKTNHISEYQLIDAQRVNLYGTIILFTLTLVACWPADMKIDSLYSYLYARSNQLTDGRSLLYMLIWQMTFVITYKPWPMLFLHLGLYWTGWWLFAETLRHRLGYLSFIPIVVAALPWMIGLSGTLLEQPLIANILLVAAVLLLRQIQKQTFLLSKKLLLIGLLYCAYSMRVLDGLAVIPFIYILIDMMKIQHSNTRKITYNILGVILVIILFSFISSNIENIVKPQRVYKEKTILSHFHALACNHPNFNNQNEYFNIYFKQMEVWRIGQPYYEEYVELLKQSKLTALSHLAKKIKDNPMNFIKNYLLCLKNTLRIGNIQSGTRSLSYSKRTNINRYNLKKHNSVFNRALSQYVEYFRDSAVFRPWFLLISSAIIFIWLKVKKRNHILFKNDHKMLKTVNISAIVQLCSYIPLSIVPSYSYFLWSSVANWFCFTYLIMGAIVAAGEEIQEEGSGYN